MKYIILLILVPCYSLLLAQEHIGPNVIKNSFMDQVDESSIPVGYEIYNGSNLTIQAVHPYTKGFEGPYASVQPSNATAASVDDATESTPYWFGSSNMGPRTVRGGMSNGWHSFGNGKILKITGDNTGTHSSVNFPFESNVLTNQVRFRAWVKISSGTSISFGPDAGYKHRTAGSTITKTIADQAVDGWYRIDEVITISKVTSFDGLSFSIGVNGSGIEAYVALPHLQVLDNISGSWMPSSSDKLLRSHLYLSDKAVGIGTNLISNPNNYKLAVDGTIGAKEVVVETTSTTWPDYVFDGNYQLMPLPELNTYLKKYKHLPEIPTADEIEETGQSLGEMNTLLLKKIEELTLYVIQLEGKSNFLEKEKEAMKYREQEQNELLRQLTERLEALEK